MPRPAARPARASASPRSRALVPAAVIALAYLVALAQRPGELIADTKVHLYVDPARFLGDVLSAWTPTGDTGHVWAGQYAGYAWPMAPWFAAGEALGVPAWLVHRLWLGTLLALAALGVVRLLQSLVQSRPGVLHLAAGVLYVVNPYVTVYANRTSVALLAYAALPWLLLSVHHGLRRPHGWRWPAVFALVLTSTAGGINAAVIAFVLLAPLGLAAYELAIGDVSRRAVGSLAWRMVLVNVVVSAWWVVPTVVHAGYGLDFLPYTEQPGTIWGTSSLPEALRLMGFWTSYIGVGYGGGLRPFASHGPALLFQTGIVAASLLVPALALTSFAWVRRGRYAPFFLALALGGLLVMAAGFPDGTPLRRALTFTYNHVQPVQVLRTTYKAGPLLALGLAALGGMGAAAAWGRLAGRPRARPLLALAAAGLVAVAAWPLTTGRALEPQLAFEVPQHWRAAAAQLDGREDGTRALVLPGQLFASYRWGQTIDPILPTLTRHPVATRSIVPYADLRAVELQWAVDDLVTQERAVDGQLPALLDLLAVGDVFVAADGDRTRSGELGPVEVARALAGQGLALEPAGPPTRVQPAAQRLDEPRTLPALRHARTATGGLVRTLPRGRTTVIDGGAAGLTGLAAFGALDPATPYAYAPDLGRRALREAAARGARFVVADGNRRQAFVASRLRGNRGPVLRADQDVSEDGTMLDPFSAPAGPREGARQTVSVLLSGTLTAVSAPASPQVTQFPEHRPAAAVDGDPSTAWLADRALIPDRRVLTLRFAAPRDVPFVDVSPYSDPRAVVRAITINGRRFALGRGALPQRLPVGLRGVREVQIKLVDVLGSQTRSAGAGGLREVALPGVRAVEALRPPVTVERGLAGADLSASALTYLFSRMTADAPQRAARLRGDAAAGLLRDAQDPERRIVRRITPPAARRWALDAWVRPDPRAPDDALDRLAGVTGALRATSSSRFDGRPRHRASSAFDGSTRRAWVGQWIPGRPAWLAWRTREVTSLRTFRLVPAALRVRRPTRVRLTVDGRSGPTVPVAEDGGVVLPRDLRGRAFRLDIVAARFAAGTPPRLRQRRAVAVGELAAAGVPRLRVPLTGRMDARCGSARVGADGPGAARVVELRVDADRPAFEAGRALRARACGPPVLLPAGPTTVRGLAAPLVVDHLRMDSAAPEPRSGDAARGATYGATAGRGGNGERTGASARTAGPAWLVLGESYSRGWRASCDGRDLGAPVPMQGYANAWPIERPGCAVADFAFVADDALAPARALSLAGALAALLVLLAGLRRHRGSSAPRPADPAPLEDVAPPAVALRRALALGVLASLVLGFVFALRAGAVLGPLVALILWRQIPTRTLVLTAGALLGLVVPALYVLFEGDDRGGYSTTYATDHLGAHWVAVGAVALLLFAAARSLSTARGRRGGRAPAPGAAVRRGSAP